MAKGKKKNLTMEELLNHKVCGCVDMREIINKSAEISTRAKGHCSFSHTVIMMLATHIYIHEIRSSNMPSNEVEEMIDDAFEVSKRIFDDCMPYIEKRMSMISDRLALSALSTEGMTPQ